MFERTARKSPGREALKARSKLSDEQLEGWFIMFERNPKRDALLNDFEIDRYLNRFNDAKGNGDAGATESGAERSRRPQFSRGRGSRGRGRARAQRRGT